ncbi:putative N-acetyltransferase YycN [Pseudovibrio axinellae]|uniref:Putative N-acetyltransferase YycN n=1 Tax=Pseudovibrio axinellae TaxID=989403 RepID=A0A165T6G7_9HYPH|nr:GNAT family N-acetyltransferase [Pseudovibrio axinellae]KZL05502.1 putative N-acetyltransferase YycN [Pseudovibrio axinellae]SEP96464.1 Protein N-acetyltransferase, RimJ/RimL family [Pseudovibrio axinellae]
MIQLQNYDPAQFSQFKKVSTTEYVKDIMSNHRMEEQAAMAKASNAITDAFPDGMNTDQNKLLSIVLETDEGPTSVGHLWYSYTNETTAFIMDFLVDAEHRGKGIATEALIILKAALKADGLSRIGLRVEPTNKAAIRVYEKIGFSVTGWNMVSTL